MSEATERKSIVLVYAGRREGESNKLIHVYYEGNERHLFSKSLYPSTVGAKIQIDATLDSEKVYVNTAKYIGHEESDRVTSWDTEDTAHAAIVRGRKAAKSVDPFKMHLKPIKDAMWNMSTEQRAAVVTAVVRELMS